MAARPRSRLSSVSLLLFFSPPLSSPLLPPMLPLPPCRTPAPAKLFLAWEKKVFTLRQRPAGITLCSHWLKPTVATPWFAYFPVLQDFEKKKRRERRERSLSLLLYVDFLQRCFVCACKKEKDWCGSRSTNSWTTSTTLFCTGHVGGAGPTSAATVRQRLMTPLRTRGCTACVGRFGARKRRMNSTWGSPRFQISG